MSVIEPYNTLYNDTLRDHTVYGQIKLMIQQQEKTLRDYETVKQKAPRLVNPEFLTSNEAVSLEEATILEENGFYGITGLYMREFLKR